MSQESAAEPAHRSDQPGAEAASGATGVAWLIAIYFLSGVCSLIDEVVWLRLLKLTLGNTVYASTIVVSTFMGGLALGALLMGRFADRIVRRLRLYAILELLVTVTALSLPFLLGLADRFYQWAFHSLEPSPALLTTMQIGVSAAILLVPTVLMGSTLPLLSTHVALLSRRVGMPVGRLYALNMLGAALGTFLAGFVLIRVVGVMGSLYCAAALNIVVALGGLALSRRHDRAELRQAESGPTPGTAQRDRASGAPIGRRVLIAGFFMSGFISIGYEIAWMRAVAYQLGSFTYVFSAVLFVYLLGNVLGALVGSRLALRVRDPAATFGACLICLGLSGVLFVPWVAAWFSGLQEVIRPLLEALARTRQFSLTAEPLVHGLALFLVSSILMGLGFPLAVQAWNGMTARVGRTTATVYGANTIGSVLGGVITGLLLIPLLGTQASLLLLAVVAAGIGVLLLLLGSRGAGRVGRVAWCAVAVATLLGAILLPTDHLNQRLLRLARLRTVAVKEGVTTTASIREGIEGSRRVRWIASSNIVVGGDGVSRTGQKTLGHLPVLLNKGARKVLSIGFGSGETTDCLVRHELERVDCVEIAPELVEMAVSHLSHINLGERLSEEVEMIFLDAKNYLLLTERRYDLIMNDSNYPSQPGSAPLFAKEHFENSMRHLEPGGLFMTKLHMDHVPLSSLLSIMGTFLDVFPHATLWFPVSKPYHFFYMVGSREEQSFSPRHIETELGREAVGDSVALLNWTTSHEVLSGYLGDEKDIRLFLREYQVNSDDRPFVEFNLERSRPLVRTGFFQEFIDTVRTGSLARHLDFAGMSAAEQAEWLRGHRRMEQIAADLLAVFVEQDNWAKLMKNRRALQRHPESRPLRDQLESILVALRRSFEARKLDERAALAATERMIQQDREFGGAWVVRSWLLARRGQQAEALRAASKGAESAPFSALGQANLGSFLLAEGQNAAALLRFQEAERLDPDDPGVLRKMARAHAGLGQSAEAQRLRQRAIRLNPLLDPVE